MALHAVNKEISSTGAPASGPSAGRKPVAWRARALGFALMAALTLGSFEAVLRVVPLLVRDPLRSILQEAQRIPYSNLRTHSGLKGGTTILLPPTASADYLLVGASMAFGTYVRDEDTFAHRLASLSAKRVINLAVGSQPPSSFNRMLEVGSRYHPKEILYVFSVNDFAAAPAEKPRELRAESSAHRLPGDKDLYLEQLGFSDILVGGLKRFTNLFLSYQLRKLFQQPAVHNASIPWHLGEHYFVFTGRRYWDAGLSWNNERVRNAAAFNVALVEEGRRFASTWGAKVRVALLPSKEIVYAPDAGELAAKFYDPVHLLTFENFGNLLAARGIPVLDLTPSLRAEAHLGKKLYFSLDGHFNEEGHQAIARALHAFLESKEGTR